MPTAVKIAVYEYERGWGNRIDDWMVCISVKDALNFKKDFNSKNVEENVPDWYMVCKDEPEPIDLNDAQFELLKNKGNLWLSSLKLIS